MRKNGPSVNTTHKDTPSQVRKCRTSLPSWLAIFITGKHVLDSDTCFLVMGNIRRFQDLSKLKISGEAKEWYVLRRTKSFRIVLEEEAWPVSDLWGTCSSGNSVVRRWLLPLKTMLLWHWEDQEARLLFKKLLEDSYPFGDDMRADSRKFGEGKGRPLT